MEDKYIKYDEYVTNHKNAVCEAYKLLIEKDILEYDSKVELNLKQHDLSKNCPLEYEAYAEYFYGGNEEDEKVSLTFDYAWNHHQKHNEHHWQYWVLLKDSGGEIILEMPSMYIIEMICDWMAFGIINKNVKDICKWYSKNKSKMKLGKLTKKVVEEIIEEINNKF